MRGHQKLPKWSNIGRISHKILKQKLLAYGISGKIFRWIANFLSDRGQRVRVNNSFSELASVSSGVPQGSVLGPLLFLVYINDLPNVIKNSSIKIFADDSKIFFKFKKNTNYNKFIDDVTRVFEWVNKNRLKVAMEKCEVLHLGCNNPAYPLYYDGNNIAVANNVKDLGVYVSVDLSFNYHIS